jgi:peptidoglycan/xylan/chitin deacetylase (PgdA/CDA1 family)
MADFRLDRALTVGVMRTLSGLRGDMKQLRVPILMYHRIREGSGDRHPFYETSTSPRLFAEHMRYLNENGYRTVGLDDVMNGSPASEPRVAITFDDGYEDFYTHALPVLSSYGFRATVFVVSSFPQCPERNLGQDRYLNWTQIRELLALGNEIGSHTVSHPDLHRIPGERLEYEVAESKRVIEQETGARIDSFAYPYAFPEHDIGFLAALRAILCRNGYAKGVCTSIGTAKPNADCFFMPRIPINSFDDLRLFEAKLAGAYDWMHIVQSLRRRVARRPLTPTPLAYHKA